MVLFILLGNLFQKKTILTISIIIGIGFVSIFSLSEIISDNIEPQIENTETQIENKNTFDEFLLELSDGSFDETDRVSILLDEAFAQRLG